MQFEKMSDQTLVTQAFAVLAAMKADVDPALFKIYRVALSNKNQLFIDGILELKRQSDELNESLSADLVQDLWKR